MTVLEVAQALGASCTGDGQQPVRRVVIDSRAVVPGDLFVALVGARTDGHEHLRQALAKGAVAALVMPDRGERPTGLEVLVVPDTLKAMGALARFHLARMQAKVFGITGSVGKTTAKDFLFQLLGGAARQVFAAPASYNSEVGLPLAILAAPLETRLLVLEYGINAPGEMDVLLSIAKPDGAWITAVGASHLEGLGDVAKVASEKAKLAAAVSEQGTVWLEAKLADQLEDLRADWQARVVSCAPLEEEGMQVHARRPGDWRLQHGQWGALRSGLFAEHEIITALMAARIAGSLGQTSEELQRRLPQLVPPQGRLSIVKRDGLTILDDAYNANPLSMTAALQVLQDWQGPGRRIAVLGSMKELGPTSEELHRQVGREVAACGCALLVGVGSGGAWIAEGVDGKIPCRVVDDAEGAAEILKNTLRSGDVVLLKASRSEALERILPGLGQTQDKEESVR
ncbi:MAG: UDP-N-acetylmuramoyl-tripeptide--D-alanyl-D-alanine ligase [Planctomycetota bacterium]